MCEIKFCDMTSLLYSWCSAVDAAVDNSEFVQTRRLNIQLFAYIPRTDIIIICRCGISSSLKMYFTYKNTRPRIEIPDV